MKSSHQQLIIIFSFIAARCLNMIHAHGNHSHHPLGGHHNYAPEVFSKIGNSLPHPTDKVSYHHYSLMYGMFLFPLIHEAHLFGKSVKFLEIGT
jgi:hypothetical protein